MNEKRIKEGKATIRKAAKLFEVKKDLLKETENLFLSLYKARFNACRDLENVALSSLLHTLRIKNESPTVTIEDFLNQTSRLGDAEKTRKLFLKIGKRTKRFSHPRFLQATTFIESGGKKLELSKQVIEEGKKIIKRAISRGLTIQNPITLASGSLYKAAMKFGEYRTYGEFREAFDTGKKSMKRVLKEL